MAKARRAFKVTKKSFRVAKGADAAKKLKKQYHHELAILRGDKAPTYEESLNLLMSMIPHIDDTAGYSNDELLAIAPFLVMLTQVHGRGDYYVITDIEVECFLNGLTNHGWNVATFPPEIPTFQHLQGPRSTTIPFGKCSYDLSESQNSLAKKQREEKAARAIGKEYKPEPFQQKQCRKEGATVFFQMTIRQNFPEFGIKDKRNRQVSRKHITPFKDDDAMVIEVVSKHHEEEYKRAFEHNHKVIVRACRYIIWSMRNPEADTTRQVFPAITFESLDMYNPVYQHALLARFGEKLLEVSSGAIDDSSTAQSPLRVQDWEIMRTFVETY